jgi:hypothetical protein
MSSKKHTLKWFNYRIGKYIYHLKDNDSATLFDYKHIAFKIKNLEHCVRLNKYQDKYKIFYSELK